MDFKRLSYFLAVAEELHFGRASTRLGIAQPPLSRQIAQLEKEIGAVLFDRSRSQIRLTQAGELLLERAKEILERIDQTEREVMRIGQGVAGRLRIAFVGTATYGLLPYILRAFRTANPAIELALSAMNNADLKRALIQREIDIAVARPSIEDPEVKSESLGREPLILALPDTFAEGEHVLADLKGETFILYPRRPRPSFADFIIGCQLETTMPFNDYWPGVPPLTAISKLAPPPMPVRVTIDCTGVAKSSVSRRCARLAGRFA